MTKKSIFELKYHEHCCKLYTNEWHPNDQMWYNDTVVDNDINDSFIFEGFLP